MTLTRRGAMRLAPAVASLPLIRRAAAQGRAGPAGVRRGGVQWHDGKPFTAAEAACIRVG